MTTQLNDTFTMDGVRRTNDGYLTAFARVARTGIQTYRGSELGRPDLETVRVYRSPEEVFAPDALRSFAHRPITLKHPPGAVTAANWKKYSGGLTGGEVVRDGEYVRVPMVMMDASLIDAYEKKGIDQLSMGYSTDIKWRAGVTDAGEPYDALQTAIRANHLAVVPLARGGDKLRIGDDDSNSSADDDENCPECGTEMQDGKCPNCGYTQDGEPEMKNIVVDGLQVSVADDQSASIIQKTLDTLAARIKDAEAHITAKQEAQDALVNAQKAVETKDGEIAVLKQQLADAEITPAKLDVMVKDRLAVIDAASKLVSKDFAFDGKSLGEIRKAAVEVRLGDAAKAMSDAAIEGAFAALVADSSGKEGTQPIADALRGTRPSATTGNRSVQDSAYEESVKALASRWKTPPLAH